MKSDSRLGGRRRRGYVLMLVLLMIGMTLSVSYALVRSQTSTSRLTLNGGLREAARQAAWTGLSAAMRRISQTSWGGVGSTITGNVSNSASFVAAYATGDAKLSTTDANAADWPLRVTISTTGFASDASGISAVPAAYRLESVVQLVPKQLASNPPPWATMMNYVYYQTAADNLAVQLPFQIDGPQRWQGALQTLASAYPKPATSLTRFLNDLNVMRANGYGDYRPFTGPITLSLGATTSTNRNLLSTQLGLTLSDVSPVTTSFFGHPGSPTGYRLYAGGATYSIPTLPATVSGTTYAADPRTNPAGVFLRSGDLTIGNNTTVVGTLITTGNLILTGTNVSLRPAVLTRLVNASADPEFPVIVANADVRVTGGSHASVRGSVVSFADFVSLSGSQATTFTMQGNLVARSLDIQSRTDWNFGSFIWSLLSSAFNSQLTGGSPVIYFPVFLQNSYGLNYTPLLTVSSQTGSVTRQWFSADTPVYSVYTGDAGLQWSTIRVTELR